MDFARGACSKEEYRDWFLISVMDGKASSTTRREKTIRLVWFCSGLDKNSKDDSRNHEALLRHHFRKYDLIIEKKSGRWVILVVTPQPSPTQPPFVKVVVRCAAAATKRAHDELEK